MKNSGKIVAIAKKPKPAITVTMAQLSGCRMSSRLSIHTSHGLAGRIEYDMRKDSNKKVTDHHHEGDSQGVSGVQLYIRAIH